MSEFETLADLFPADKQPTRGLEPIQKVDRTDRIERDIDEFHETESAKRVLRETAAIVANEGVDHRFRYVHATFGSGKSHLLKLIGVATGELEGLESYAHDLANTTTGFKEFRDAIADSHIDHLQPLFLNLLDRDRDETKLPLILYEELGRQRGYHTSLPWLLEFCWQLDIEHGLWDQLTAFEHEGLQLHDVVDRPASLRPWLQQTIPELDGAAAAGLDSTAAVDAAIDRAEAAIDPAAFTPDDLVDRLQRTKHHLEQDGETYQYLVGLDEIAIYVGDQQRRYEEVVETVTALIDSLNPPILGTGQWPMRDMQQNFVGDVDDDAWYAREVELEGADTETIVRKRWLQKSDEGAEYIESELLANAPEIEPTLADWANPPAHNDPIEAYPFRDLDLWLLRDSMQGLVEGDRDTEREYIQGRALLARVRSLFVKHGWATRSPGAIVPWDTVFDVIESDTELISGWAVDLIGRVENSIGNETATRTAKALFLLSQVGTVPRTTENLVRLLVDDVDTDVAELATTVESQLEEMAERNLIREDTDAENPTYTILSEEEIQFWGQVEQEATDLPDHQVQNNVREIIRDVDPTRLPAHEGTETGDFGDRRGITYTVRYAIDRSVPDSVTEAYDTVVIRVLVHDEETIATERERWQEAHAGPNGREDVLITVELTETIRKQVRRLVGMQNVLGGMADPEPEHRLQRQSMEEELEDELQERLDNAAVYLPQREAAYGSYLESLDDAVAAAVDEKFPNRKSVEHRLRIEDLQEFIDFFDGDDPWPLSDADADLLGVNPVPAAVSNGWAMEFLELDRFDTDERVTGERVLETIDGRGGEFLGTPEETLQTLLFVLVAAGKVGLRVDGDRVTDTRTVASTITNTSEFEDAIVVFDPSPPPEDLSDVYAALVGDTAETDDTQELLDGIEAWVTEHAEEFNTVVSRTNLEFSSRLSLGELKSALKPALSGGELDPNRLTDERIVEQAERYGDARALFSPTGDDAPLWDRVTAVAEWLAEHYPTASITGKLSATRNGSRLPSVETVESQLEEAHAHRVEALQTLSRQLTGEQPTVDGIGSLRKQLTETLRSEALAADMERVTETYPQVSLRTLRATVDDAHAAEGALTEETLAGSELRDDAETLADGRALLETEHRGKTLHAALLELDDEFPDRPDEFVARRISRAVSGATIPAPDRAVELIDQARTVLAGGDGGEGDLWQRVSEYDEGTVVVIDTEDTQ